MMLLRSYRYFQALILFALGMFLFGKFASGKLAWYIHQRFWPLTLLGVLLLLVLGQAVIVAARRTPVAAGYVRSAWGLLILLLPLLTGWVLPAGPLNASAIASKGIDTAIPLASGGAVFQFDAAAEERNILDWLRLAAAGQEIAGFAGQPVDLIGFVYRDPRLPANQFMVSRFALVCCAADAFAIGLAVQWPEAAGLQQDSWVKVVGKMQTTEIDGKIQFLVLADSVDAAELPDQPYLFP